MLKLLLSQGIWQSNYLDKFLISYAPLLHTLLQAPLRSSCCIHVMMPTSILIWPLLTANLYLLCNIGKMPVL